MSGTDSHPGRAARMQEAINSHDLEALVTSFASDLTSDQPAHPARSFHGRDQVRTNWAMIFSMVPDLKATLLRSSVDDGVEWAEWAWDGTRADGGHFGLRGVTIHGLENDEIRWVHFYMEPLEQAGSGVETAVKSAVGAK